MAQKFVVRAVGIFWAVVCVVLLFGANARANDTIRQTFNNLPYTTNASSTQCNACHSSLPDGSNANTNSAIAGGPQGPLGVLLDNQAIDGALITQFIDNNFAPRLGTVAGAVTFDKRLPAGTTVVAVPVTSAGGLAFRTGVLPTAGDISLSDDHARFTTNGSGASWNLETSAGFANIYDAQTVTVSSLSRENLFHSTARTSVITVNLANNLPDSLAAATFAVAEVGVDKTFQLTAIDPDGDAVHFEGLTPLGSSNCGANCGSATISDAGLVSFIAPVAPQVVASGYRQDFQVTVTNRRGDNSLVGSTNFTFSITAVAGTNNTPVGSTASFTVDDNGTDEATGAIATDVDGGPLSYISGGNTVAINTAFVLPHGTITIAADNSFTYKSKPNDSVADVFVYTVSDSGGLDDTGTLTFNKNAIDDDPTVKAGTFVKEVKVSDSQPQKTTSIDLKAYVEDPDTPINQLRFRVLRVFDTDGSASSPATFGTFTPSLPGVVSNGVFTYRNRAKVALDFTVQFRVGPPGADPSSAACAASDPDCGEVRVQVFLNERGRHSPAERLQLAASLGKSYKTIPGSVGHFPDAQGNGACLNCHIAGKVTAAAPSCGNRQFFNELGRRLCLIRPFQTPFNSRIVEAIKGTTLGEDSFEPTVTLAQSVIDVSDATAVGKAVSAPMQFGVGLDLDGKRSRILKAYIPDATARSFFDIKITNNGAGSGTATGVLVVKRKLSEYSGSGQIQVQPLPVNFGAVRTNQTGSIDANGEGFYPFHTENLVSTLRVTVVRSLPKVTDDSYQTNIDPAPFTMDVTANDKGGGTIDRVEIVTQPANGKVTATGKTIVFVSDGAGTGADSFTYRAVRNGVGPSETNATVSLQIFDADDAVAQPDSYKTVIGETELFDVLANDRGPAPDSFRLVPGQLPQLGSARFVGGELEYKALRDGTDVFAYEVTGGGVTTQAKVTVRVGKVNGDVLAAATNRPDLKPVARALGDTCAQIDSNGNATSQQRDLARICNGLVDDATTAGAIDDALEAIRNEEVLVAGDAAQQHDRLAASNLLARLDAVRGGSARGLSFSQFNLQIDGQTLPGSAVDAMIQQASADGMASPKGDLPWGAFVAGTVTLATKDSSDREAGFDLNGIMMTAGADYALNDQALLGLAVSLGRSVTDFDSGGELDSFTGQLATYGSFDLGNGLSIDGYGGLAFSDFEMERQIAFGSSGGAINRTAVGNFDGEMLSAAVRLKYATQMGSINLESYGTLSYSAVWMDAYTERGAQGLSLAVGDQEFDTISATVGFRLSDAIVTEHGVFKPFLGLAYTRQLDSDKRSVFSQFAAGGASGPAFSVSTESDGENTGTIEIGFSADLANDATVMADVSGSFSDDGLQAYQIKAGISFPLWRRDDVSEPVADAPVPRKRKLSQRKSAATRADEPAADDDGMSNGTSGGGGTPGGSGWGG